jgi:transcriptional regulator with XRE-family HTH domain
MKLGKHRETGLRLKAVREHLRKTLDVISEETGMSRSYISEFERGIKLPTAKYMKYLFDGHNISLDYIYGGEAAMLRLTAEEKAEKIDFGKMSDEVEELLRFMAGMPHAMYAVLAFFQEYKMKNRQLIQDHASGQKGEPHDY